MRSNTATVATTMPTLIVTPDGPTAAQSAATLMAGAIATAAQTGHPIHIALAGGTTPRHAYEQLAAAVDDWTPVHLWLGDERVVPSDHPDSNAAMVVESLTGRVDLPSEQFHLVPTELGGAQAASAYEDEIRQALPIDLSGTPIFDVVMLGIGEDAHMASLFPGSPGLTRNGTVCIYEPEAPKPPPERVSLTLQAIAAARLRLVLASGPAKAGAVAAALESEPTPHAPASMLPREGTTWIVDDAAASALDLGDDRP